VIDNEAFGFLVPSSQPEPILGCIYDTSTFRQVPGTSVVDPDPNPHSFACLGSGSNSMEIDQNLQINLVSCLSKRLLYLRWYGMFHHTARYCDEI
jgi:hypothetical protein